MDELEGRLRDAGYRFAFDAIRVKFAPTTADMQVAEESGTDLAQAVLKKARAGRRAAGLGDAGATDAQRAVGRVVGSLCVVTAADGGAASAMLASWVSQAAFDPPSLTVAVKRDRAAEPFLVTGAKFCVNVLAEGREKSAVKALSKPFKPGEDRFAEWAGVTPSPASGAALLPDAASFVECEVVNRMDAGDHVIVLATVTGGGVLDEGAVSAVHHRKSGATY